MNHFVLRNPLIALLGIICTFGVSAWGQATSPFGAYSLYPQGTARVMGMGGVFAATTDDASGTVFNPAGPALEKWSFDITGTSNRVDDQDKVTKSVSYMPSSTLTDGFNRGPYTYNFFSTAVRLGSMVFGAGQSRPYDFRTNYGNQITPEVTSEQRSAMVSVENYDAFIGAKLGDTLGLGVAGHYSKLSEHYSENGLGFGRHYVYANHESTTPWFSAGLAFKNKKGGVGVTYFQGYRLKGDSAKNSALYADTANYYSMFREVAVPARTVFGGSAQVSDRLLAAFDIEVIDVPSGLVDVQLSLTGNVEVPLQSGTRQLMKGGVEWSVLKQRNMELIVRGGAYQEPNRLRDGGSRFHRTFGLQVRFGFAVLAVSFDQAENFNNTSQGFSIIAGEI